MLTLLTYPAGFDLFSLSPFCVKAAYLLQLSGQDWKRQDTSDPRKMPMQKFPVLKTSQRLVADSEAIRVWLESKGADFDPGLSDQQKAQSRSMIRMADEYLYFHVVMDRWGNDDVWPTLRETLFHEVPALIRRPVANGLRKTLRKGLNTQGIARFSPQQRLDMLDKDLQALATVLKETPFLFGDKPTAADLSVAPMLDALRATPVNTPVVNRVAKDSVLTQYLDRMTQAVPLP
jgi:glutathione S-transferase